MIKTFEQFVLENLNTSNELNAKRLKPHISKIVDTVKTIMDELTAAELGGGGTISEDINLGGKMYTIAVDYDILDEYFERGEDNRYDDRYVAVDYGLTGFTVESGDYRITNEELGIKEPTHSDLFKVYTGFVKKQNYHLTLLNRH
jgi:hypothetical protein